jgi:hypothetical protein
MRRVVVVGQAAPRGLCFCEFARSLAARLDARHLASPSDTPPTQASAEDAWVATEPAGLFSEHLFRRADTVVWLHFSPLPFVKDWLARLRDAASLRRLSESGRGARSTWRHVMLSFDYLRVAPQMYRLFGHPALAHVRLVELRSPQQADFWLMTQRRRG